MQSCHKWVFTYPKDWAYLPNQLQPPAAHGSILLHMALKHAVVLMPVPLGPPPLVSPFDCDAV